MNKKPLVSVIIPTYNRGKILSRTIRNVLNQNFNSLEVIIVDDGSTDNTKEIVEEMQKKDKRIKYLYQKNRGPGIARIAGVKIANGEFIHFLDSDDLILPGFYEKSVEKLENTSQKVGFVYCKGCCVDPKTLKILSVNWGKIEGNLFTYAIKGKVSFAGVHTWLIKKYVFEKIKFEDDEIFSKAGGDVYIGKKILKNFDGVFLDEYLTVYFVQSDKEAITGKKYFKEKIGVHIAAEIKDLEMYKEDYEKNPKELSNKYMKIGSYYIISKKYTDGRKYLIKALLKNPINFLTLFFLLLSFLGSETFFFIREIIKKVKHFGWWFDFYTKVYIRNKKEMKRIEYFIKKSLN